MTEEHNAPDGGGKNILDVRMGLTTKDTKSTRYL